MLEETEGRKTQLQSENSGELIINQNISLHSIINNRYSIKERIGAGGSGVVFQATDLKLEIDVALKFLYPEVCYNKRSFQRVKREINITRSITDPRIVKVFSFEEYNNANINFPFFIMELVNGRSLKSILDKQKRLEWKEFKPVFLEILEGVRTLHNHDIIHRDLKPSNIMIAESGTVKILDFGLAKALYDEEKTSSIGDIIGTPQYMSPEQILNKDIDERSDLYQLGVILYRVLSGEFPFSESLPMTNLMLNKFSSKPKKLADCDVALPRYLIFGTNKAMEMQKKSRFQNIDTMILYFKKSKYKPLSALLQNLKKYTFRMVISIALPVILLATVFSVMHSSSEPARVTFKGSHLALRNILGRKLMEKNFTKETVIEATVCKVKFRAENRRGEYQQKKGALAITIPVNKNYYSGFTSFTGFSSEDSLYFVSTDWIQKKDPKSWFSTNLVYYDFANSFRLTDIYNKDLNGDGENEQLILQINNSGMYPTGLHILVRGYHSSFFNPGQFNYADSKSDDDGNIKILFTGQNNIFCHNSFLAQEEIEIKYVRGYLQPNFNRTFFTPTLKKSKMENFNGLLIILPRSSHLISNHWFMHKGTVKFRHKKKRDEVIEVNNRGQITLYSERKTQRYYDSLDTLIRVFDLLDSFYKKKTLTRDYRSALEDVDQALEYRITNPWLKSTLLFFKGDLIYRLGNQEEALKTIDKSIEYDSFNIDAIQRKCEIYFLNDDIATSQRLININPVDRLDFWGLQNMGVHLFGFYCELQNGQYLKFAESTAFVGNKIRNYTPLITKYLNGMNCVFRGQYKKALSEVRFLYGKRPTPFTVIEFRLLFSRTILLNSLLNKEYSNSEDLKLADFYFKDIATNSISSHQHANLSRYWFLSETGTPEELKNMARQSFGNVLKLSREEFFVKLWLFYDAFIYGKLMERFNDIPEAIRGYRTSIKANPHTDLANRSKAALKRLKTENSN